MKANELRIGNYVYRQSDKMILNRDSVYQIEVVTRQTESKYDPIPLTSEWLIKFGKKADTSDSFGGFIIPLPNGNGLRIKDNKWNAQHSETKVDFVHQLQNLYYSITGEELSLY